MIDPENRSKDVPDQDDRPLLLLVDDEPAVLMAVRRLLRREPCRIITAKNGREALEIIRENDVQVILSDEKMPQMTGLQFLREAKQVRPEAIRLLLTGQVEVDVALRAINEGEVYRVLTKPWQNYELLGAVREALVRHRLERENSRIQRELSLYAGFFYALFEEYPHLKQELEVWRKSGGLLSEVGREVNEERNRELRLVLLYLAFQEVDDPLAMIDGTGVVIDANRAFSSLARTSPEQAKGRAILELLESLLEADVLNRLDETVGRFDQMCERVVVRAAGRVRRATLQVTPYQRPAQRQMAFLLHLKGLADEPEGA
jgi:PAS domain S-box-containing protein